MHKLSVLRFNRAQQNLNWIFERFQMGTEMVNRLLGEFYLNITKKHCILNASCYL